MPKIIMLKKSLIVLIILSIALAIIDILPTKLPVLHDVDFGEHCLQIKYLGATGADFFPTKGLDEIELQCNCNIEYFHHTGKPFTMSYEEVIGTEFIIFGHIEKLVPAVFFNDKRNYYLIFYVKDYAPVDYMMNLFYADGIFWIVLVILTALLIPLTFITASLYIILVIRRNRDAA